MALSQRIWVLERLHSNHFWDWSAFVIANLLILLSFCDVCCCDKYAKRRNKELLQSMTNLSISDETLNRNILAKWRSRYSSGDFYSQLQSPTQIDHNINNNKKYKYYQETTADDVTARGSLESAPDQYQTMMGLDDVVNVEN